MWKIFSKKSQPNKSWLITASLAYVAMLIVNGIAGSTSWLGGVNTGEVSDSYGNLFAPAGFTFAIWGVIYLTLGIFLLRAWGVIKADKNSLKPVKINQLLILFSITSLINFAWIFAWQYKILAFSVVLIIGLLLVLKKISKELADEKMGTKDHLLIRAPFSLYLGWITVATIANITTWLVSINWDGFGLSDGTWMVAVLLVGAVIGIVNTLKNRDWIYLSVFVWAYSGILFKHLSGNAFDGKYPSTLAALYIILPIFISTAIFVMATWPYGKSSRSVFKK